MDPYYYDGRTGVWMVHNPNEDGADFPNGICENIDGDLMITGYVRPVVEISKTLVTPVNN